MPVQPEAPKCAECGRDAKTFVVRKYPAKGDKIKKWFCGYHTRPYLTSEFKRRDIVRLEPPPKIKVGYAPEVI